MTEVLSSYLHEFEIYNNFQVLVFQSNGLLPRQLIIQNSQLSQMYGPLEYC